MSIASFQSDSGNVQIERSRTGDSHDIQAKTMKYLRIEFSDEEGRQRIPKWLLCITDAFRNVTVQPNICTILPGRAFKTRRLLPELATECSPTKARKRGQHVSVWYTICHVTSVTSHSESNRKIKAVNTTQRRIFWYQCGAWVFNTRL